MLKLYVQKIANKIKKILFGSDELYENVNFAGNKKRCLIAYITRPFKTLGVSKSHQNQSQSLELARIIGEFGYNVDVIDYNANKVKFRCKYDLIVDIHPRSKSIYSACLNDGCKKIAYLTGSNTYFSNSAEQQRITDLEQRRGVKLLPRRQAPPCEPEALNTFDGVMFIGNEYNLATYNMFDLRKFWLIKNTGYEFLLTENFQNKSPANFLFLASTGQVHKGLDLLLEAFSSLQGVRLYVCSKYHEEEDFCTAYNRELFESPSVIPVGFLDITGKRFRQVLAECSYILLPSCSEGLCGSVLTAMSGGLVPIVSRECGFDDDEVIHLPDCSIETIQRYVLDYARKSPQWLADEGERMRVIIRNRYSNYAYSESVRIAIKGILTT